MVARCMLVWHTEAAYGASQTSHPPAIGGPRMNPTEEDPREQGYPPPAGGQGGYQGYPPPPPGYPPQGPGYQPPGYPRQAPQNLSLSDLFRRWQAVITGRSVSTFDEQQSAASWPNIWVGLAVYAVIRGIVSAISTAINPTVRIGNTVVSAGSPDSNFITGVFGAFIGFFVAAGYLFSPPKMVFRPRDSL